jgi:prevent-host-death family protein
MTKVGVYQAKTHLAALLDRVEKGERVVITRHGTPVAVLIPPEPGRMSTREAIARIRELRLEMRLDGLNIRRLIDEGRR